MSLATVIVADIIDNASRSGTRAIDAIRLWGTVAAIGVILAVLVMTRSLPKVFGSIILVGIALAAIYSPDSVRQAVTGLLF